MRVDATSYADASERILAWARRGGARRVSIANVHMTMEAYDDPSFQELINGSDLVTPDGVPLVWALRLLGTPTATRVYGPTLTLHVCEAAARSGIPIGLFGGTPDSLDSFVSFLSARFPGIHIACRIAPPFRPITSEEDERYTSEIVSSGARILLVGIGCPKQERWIAAHAEKIDAVMLGVGAAFDFHSGRVRQAPAFLQNVGLEWLFRLVMEPRRLWRRYTRHNPRFVGLFLMQLAKMKRFS